MHKRKQPETPVTVEPMLLTIQQVADALGVGRTKVYDLIKNEGLPTVPLGENGDKRVYKASLQEWIEQREMRPGA